MQTPAPTNPESARWPWLLAAQSAAGRVWLAAFAAAALYPGLDYMALAFAAAIGLASFRPGWRRPTLSTLAILVCVRASLPSWPALALLALWMAGLLEIGRASCRERG